MQCFCVQRNMILLSPPPARAQAYVQGAVLQMTGDEGAVLLCAEERNMNAFVPPAPAQDYVQGAVLQMTGDQGAVLLCAEEHERFCPPPPPQPNPKWLSQVMI